jgi:hypothetical protein
MNYDFLVISIILWLFIIFFISIVVTVEIKMKNLCKFKKLYEYEGEQGTVIGLQIIPLI